jgi:hypothetical protein
MTAIGATWPFTTRSAKVSNPYPQQPFCDTGGPSVLGHVEKDRTREPAIGLALECSRSPDDRRRSRRGFGRAIPCSAAAQQRQKVIRNRVALAGEESVSGLTRGSGRGSKPGEPTHAHLHHRQ